MRMTDPLHIAGRPDAPIACDMTTAEDTPDARLAEYERLFETALVRRERAKDRVEFAFRADAGLRARLDALARREAACCPFLGYHVETVGDEVIWAISNPRPGEERASVDAMLDAFYALPGDTGLMDGLLARLADRGAARRASKAVTQSSGQIPVEDQVAPPPEIGCSPDVAGPRRT